MSGINRTSASFLGTSSGESGADMFTSVIFLHLPNTLTPQFWDHTPNCQCSITAYKAVCNGLQFVIVSGYILHYMRMCKSVQILNALNIFRNFLKIHHSLIIRLFCVHLQYMNFIGLFLTCVMLLQQKKMTWTSVSPAHIYVQLLAEKPPQILDLMDLAIVFLPRDAAVLARSWES